MDDNLFFLMDLARIGNYQVVLQPPPASKASSSQPARIVSRQTDDRLFECGRLVSAATNQ